MKKLIFILILFSIYGNSNSQEMKVTDTSINVSNSELKYTVNANYPQVDFGPEALMGVRGIASDINNSLDTTVSGIIKNFETSVREMPAVASNGNESSLDITGRGWITNGSLFSAELTVFNNVAGMAHPLTTVTGYNYDYRGDGPFSISDLFLSSSDYLNYISTFSIRQLTAHAEKEGYTNINDMILSGASAELKNFNNWVVENDSLRIIFNPYQAGPYVMGIQTVTISLSEMVSMIDPKGPLSFMKR